MTQHLSSPDQGQYAQPAVQQMQPTNQQMEPTDQQMQSSNQQMQPTNQQMQSSNQQMQPTNQQMQPSQGGMQSTRGSMQSTETGSTGMQSGGTLPQQYRTSLASVAEAVEVCGWCADQCIQEADPMMIECIRLCEDVVELGETVLATVPRSSRYADETVQTFQRAAQACAQECGQHQHAHCQDCAAVLSETLTATDQLIGSGSQQRW